jgi:hypothetical protein
MLREDSCRSTRAARAENFLEGDKGAREFPNEFSVRVGSSRSRDLLVKPGLVRTKLVVGRQKLLPKPHSGPGTWLRQLRIRTIQGYKSGITGGDQKRAGVE